MKPERIRDPIHDLIEFAPTAFDTMLWQLVCSAPFQRLRRIRQLGFVDFVYPGATHTRFAHSLGVLQTARRLVKVIENKIEWLDPERVEVTLAAALLHDVGHGPSSHAFEVVAHENGWQNAHHEATGKRLILETEIASILNTYRPRMALEVADMLEGKNPDIYSAVVSSQFDADRLDYMRRDRWMTGVNLGATDFEWLFNCLEIGNVTDPDTGREVPTFVLNPKGILSAEAYVLGLFHLYPTVYMHRTAHGADRMFTRLVSRLVKLITEGNVADTGLTPNHPLVAYARQPDSLEAFLALDDMVVMGACPLMAQAPDAVIADLAARLLSRNLYRCIDIRLEVERSLGHTASNGPEADEICGEIHARLLDLNLPQLLLDKLERAPYKARGGANRGILVRTFTGTLEDLRDHSPVVRAIPTFKALRAYFPPEDTALENQINAITAQVLQAHRNPLFT